MPRAPKGKLNTRVVAAVDVPGGTALLMESSPDAAFVDVGLPGFDGHELAA